MIYPNDASKRRGWHSQSDVYNYPVVSVGQMSRWDFYCHAQALNWKTEKEGEKERRSASRCVTLECDTNPYNSKLILKSRGRPGWAERGGVTLNADCRRWKKSGGKVRKLSWEGSLECEKVESERWNPHQGCKKRESGEKVNRWKGRRWRTSLRVTPPPTDSQRIRGIPQNTAL